MQVERNFERIDHEVEPRCGADEGHFVHAPREEIEGSDGAGRVGHHGGDARGHTGEKAHRRIVRRILGDFRKFPLQQGHGHEGDDQPAKKITEGRVGDQRHDPPSEHNAGGGRGDEAKQIGPTSMTPVNSHAKDIAEKHQRQEGSGGCAGGKNFRQEDDRKNPEAAETGFGHADKQGCHDGEEPRPRSEISATGLVASRDFPVNVPTARN